MALASEKAVKSIQLKVRSEQVIKHLKKMATLAPIRAEAVMGRTVAFWHALAVPHIPVRGSASKGPRGMLRKRTQPFVKRTKKQVTGGLMLMTHYAIWLVAGTARIAGGAVMRWKVGDAPIRHWPAKDQGGGAPGGELPVALPYRGKAIKKLKEEIAKEILK